MPEMNKMSFGKTPERFTNNLKSALKTADAPVRRPRFVPVLAAVLLAIMLAATALAVAGRAGLMEFFAQWGMGNMLVDPDKVTHLLDDGALLDAEVEDFHITGTEGVGEGAAYYFNTTIALREGTSGKLVPLHGEGAVEPVVTEDGSPVYYVDMYLLSGDAQPNTGDMILNEDGSLSVACDQWIQEPTDTAPMRCMIIWLKAESGEAADGTDTHTVYLPFEIPTANPLETRRLTEDVLLGDTGIAIDAISMRRLQGETQVNLLFQYAGGEGVHYLLPTFERIHINLLDGEGNPLTEHSFVGEWMDGNRYISYGRMEEGPLPDEVFIEVIDEWNHEPLAGVSLSLEEGLLSEEDMEPYRTHYMVGGPDYRDMYFNGVGFPPLVQQESVHISVPGGGAVPLYRDPYDEASLLGHYYSGLLASPNITHKEWATVFFGEFGGLDTNGYIASEYLTWDEAPVPGIPVALVAETSEGFAETRIKPETEATILFRLEAGCEVLVIGYLGDWCHVAVRDAEGARIVGHLPREALAFTGEYGSIEAYGGNWIQP